MGMSTAGQRQRSSVKRLITRVQFVNRRDVVVRPVTRLAKFNAAGCTQRDFCRRVVVNANICLLERLVIVEWAVVGCAITTGASEADDQFLAVVVIDEQVTTNVSRTDKRRVVDVCAEGAASAKEKFAR